MCAHGVALVACGIAAELRHALWSFISCIVDHSKSRCYCYCPLVIQPRCDCHCLLLSHQACHRVPHTSPYQGATHRVLHHPQCASCDGVLHHPLSCDGSYAFGHHSETMQVQDPPPCLGAGPTAMQVQDPPPCRCRTHRHAGAGPTAMQVQDPPPCRCRTHRHAGAGPSAMQVQDPPPCRCRTHRHV